MSGEAQAERRDAPPGTLSACSCSSSCRVFYTCWSGLTRYFLHFLCSRQQARGRECSELEVYLGGWQSVRGMRRRRKARGHVGGRVPTCRTRQMSSMPGRRQHTKRGHQAFISTTVLFTYMQLPRRIEFRGDPATLVLKRKHVNSNSHYNSSTCWRRKHDVSPRSIPSSFRCPVSPGRERDGCRYGKVR